MLSVFRPFPVRIVEQQFTESLRGTIGLTRGSIHWPCRRVLAASSERGAGGCSEAIPDKETWIGNQGLVPTNACEASDLSQTQRSPWAESTGRTRVPTHWQRLESLESSNRTARYQFDAIQKRAAGSLLWSLDSGRRRTEACWRLVLL